MNLKSNKGFTGVDVAIAGIVLIIFMSLITGLFYNISSTNKKIERKSMATQLAIKTIETMKKTKFEELVPNMTLNELNEVQELEENKIQNIPNGYNIVISVQKYNDEEVIKIISVEVSYINGKNTENVKLETLVKIEQQNTENVNDNG